MVKHLIRAFGSIATLGLALSLTGCNAEGLTIGGQRGVPLADLDLSGNAAPEITLLGPDNVHVVTGERLAISVDGDPAVKDRLRFVLRDGKLGIGRKDNAWSSDAVANVTVTVPSTQRLILAGSGTIDADKVRGDKAGITIAGSGTVHAPRIEAANLAVEVLGSGTLQAGGKVDSLKLTLAGSGEAKMDGLGAGSAKVDVAGSGRASFASDGAVEANIMGSGEVRVKGRATCKVSAMGSGKLVCTP
ncbi:head GIN domain-containing protein [Novosphingobium sp. FKTRR1]|uniref:head GIN domain-containing protein n=1 Tax=Novosphingobium sp. FKTRR1 TaxID=2879118 RepID=UPI001CEFD5D8|nr:head GIN domain-containing protein [Novosphingobium sp. FKTRR1]